jgi:SOS regulatory protein LexA
MSILNNYMKKSESQYLQQIKKFYFKKKRMPSYGEISLLLGFKSKFSALYWVKKWIKEGVIKKDSAGKLLPGSIFNPLKVLGEVQAGFPSPAEEENVDTISLDDWLIENKESSFMLKVSGDSMVDAGIMPGDMVIVYRGKQAKSGDIIIAEVDGQWTIKFFEQHGRKVILKAANKKYAPIEPREELRVAGVVTSVIRKY